MERPESVPPVFWGSMWGPSDMTEEELMHYRKQAIESDGFDVDYLPVEAGNIIRPLQPFSASRIEMHRLIPLTAKAVELYNSQNPDDQIRDPRLVKANFVLSCPMTYYITFKAKDSSGKSKVYQTEVDADISLDDSDVLFCRLKPKKAKRAKNTEEPADPARQAAEAVVEGEHKAEKEVKRKKRKSTAAEGKENQSEVAVEPLKKKKKKSTGMEEEQGEGAAPP